jgi:hypothetical protein
MMATPGGKLRLLAHACIVTVGRNHRLTLAEVTMKRMLRLVIHLTFSFMVPRAALAQENNLQEEPRGGFWLVLGTGASLSHVRCAPLCSEQPTQGAAATLAMGGTIGGRWLIGGEAVAWTPFESHRTFWDDHDQYLAALLTVRYYVKATGNTYVGAGIGGGGLRLVQDLLDTSGYAVQLSAGHDFRISRRFSITPYVSALQSFGDEAVVADQEVPGTVKVRFVQLGAALTLH